MLCEYVRLHNERPVALKTPPSDNIMHRRTINSPCGRTTLPIDKSVVASYSTNAAAQSFFGLLKCERVNRRQYGTERKRERISLTTSTAGSIPASLGDFN